MEYTYISHLHTFIILNISRQLQQQPFHFKDERVIEPFFIINGFWKLLDSETRDHHCRTSIGLQRSSPKYFNQNLRRISESYFNGTFEIPQHQKMLIDIEKKTRGRSNINDVILKLLTKSSESYCAKSFVQSLNAYIHSPIQRKAARKKIENDEAEKAFVELMKKNEFYFFVQKVTFDDLNRWPQMSIVSLPYFFFFNFHNNKFQQN